MVLLGEFHTNWELWGSLKCCSISLLAVPCPSDSTVTHWPGLVKRKPERSYVAPSSLSEGAQEQA